MVIQDSRKEVVQHTQTIIIDEISMVRADIMDGMDMYFRKANGIERPFGGKQVILIGDLYQIEPIMPMDERMRALFKEIYNTPFFFSSMVYNALNPVRFELEKVYRQKDPAFVNLLNRIRTGKESSMDITELNQKCYKPNEGLAEMAITLCTTNQNADIINERHMRALPDASVWYQGSVNGKFPNDMMPVPANLEMKKGAQVVIVANDSERKYVNGSVGVVEKLEENSIHVRLESGDIIELKPKIWENHSYHFNRHEKRIVSVVEGTYIQFPIKPAWAITIHKSQGLTLMKVNIDLGRGAFCSGQTYVALSRCTTLEGIRLAVPIRPRDIMVNPHVSTYYKGQHVVARHTVEDLARFFA